MTDTTQVEITLIVDADGNYVASHDEDTAFEAVEDQGLVCTRRVVRMTITVPLPKAVEVSGAIGEGDEANLVLTNA